MHTAGELRLQPAQTREAVFLPRGMCSLIFLSTVMVTCPGETLLEPTEEVEQAEQQSVHSCARDRGNTYLFFSMVHQKAVK